MPHQEIFEPIQVISFFENGRLHPLRFKWKSVVYKIIDVNSSWSQKEGAAHQHHFFVTTDSPNSFELVFDTDNFNWQVAQVYFE
jgi:hypothetical protein